MSAPMTSINGSRLVPCLMSKPFGEAPDPSLWWFLWWISKLLIERCHSGVCLLTPLSKNSLFSLIFSLVWLMWSVSNFPPGQFANLRVKLPEACQNVVCHVTQNHLNQIIQINFYAYLVTALRDWKIINWFAGSWCIFSLLLQNAEVSDV